MSKLRAGVAVVKMASLLTAFFLASYCTCAAADVPMLISR